MSAATLDLADIQGGVLRGYGFPFATYVLVRDVSPAWLAAVAGRVTSAAPWAYGKPDVAVNVALTAPGLAALGVPLDGFPYEFTAGMAARRDRLADHGPHDPSGWEDGLRGTGEAHAMVWVSGRRSDAVRALAGELAAGPGTAVVHRQDTAVLPFGREHFGFSDGFAQPSVFGSGQENRPGEGVAQRFARWRLLRPGEIVLGYEDEDGLLPPAPPRPLDRNATFMVVRKLHQDVAAWRTWLRDAAEVWAAGDEEWLAAKVCGRWTDGTPTALVSTRGSGRRAISDLNEINAFRYGRDPLGLRCPVGAHTRRVNARDGMAGGVNRTRRHRIIRRGMPYGPPLHDDVDDGVERGLWFTCFNASIGRQFETVQNWSTDGNVFGLPPSSRDFLTGGDWTGAPFHLAGTPPALVPGPDRPFVRVRGGEYLYVPSLSGLAALAS